MKKVLGSISLVGGMFFVVTLAYFAAEDNGEKGGPEYAMIATALIFIVGFIGYPILTRFWKN